MLKGSPDASLDSIALDELDLMNGIPQDKRKSVLRCLHARVSRFEEGASLVKLSGKKEAPLRYVVEGVVVFRRCDIDGNLSLLDTYPAGSVIIGGAELCQFAGSDIDIVALTDCVTLDFELTAEVDGCECCIKHVNRIRSNIIRALNTATTALMTKLALLSCRSTREKMIMYLRGCAGTYGSSSFEIQRSRQELADYLYVDRSALSRELSKMERDGLITYERNHFTLSPQLLSGAL